MNNMLQALTVRRVTVNVRQGGSTFINTCDLVSGGKGPVGVQRLATMGQTFDPRGIGLEQNGYGNELGFFASGQTELGVHAMVVTFQSGSPDRLFYADRLLVNVHNDPTLVAPFKFDAVNVDKGIINTFDIAAVIGVGKEFLISLRRFVSLNVPRNIVSYTLANLLEMRARAAVPGVSLRFERGWVGVTVSKRFNGPLIVPLQVSGAFQRPDGTTVVDQVTANIQLSLN
ncbi:MAG: hypothetical protein HY519_02535 [Candidatus Aenigmarchaeota archaeon]|nr:hypothetical protein [Candidatus Aenigmarchaeota archaeon]